MTPRIESLLSARLFLSPQLWNDRIYFISNLSGRFSLYAMEYGGSVPEPLLPPNIALQNPELLGAQSFAVLPKIGKIMVTIDNDGDEKYLPMLIPLEGGFPEPAFPQITDARVYWGIGEPGEPVAYMAAASLSQANTIAYMGDAASGELTKLDESRWEIFPAGNNKDNSRVVIALGYTFGDSAFYLWEKGEVRLLYGTPLEERKPGEEYPPEGIANIKFTESERGLLLTTAIFEDTYSLGYIDLGKPAEVQPVALSGVVHTGQGEMTELEHLDGDRYLVKYNIDGASWAYEGRFDEETLTMSLEHVICGQGELAGGVMNSSFYDKESDRVVLSFSTAASPTQIYTVEGPDRKKIVRHTSERILGIDDDLLSRGEDASYTSFDGQRVSARLYLPAEELSFEGPRPVVFYIHGGPQGQERPDFSWFSMPLIQFLTLNGFAVFVPNVRGSTGYGQSYMKHVDHDWGGNDRLDHVHAISVLAKDPRLDTSKVGVMGRSYGGYMTLTLASRHPELWSAAVDMFGPYNLLTFMDRVPETWKPYFARAVGDPETERDFVIERSPRTYVENISCPLLVIQGANDPRVIERESRDLVEDLRRMGKEAEYLVFENEGHDVIKYENKVRCYTAITDFFKQHLMETPK